jgi:hypothetical protein
MPIEIGISTTVGGIAGNTPGGTPAFSNTKSILLDGFDAFVSFSQVTYTGEFTTSFWIKPTSLNASFLVGRDTSSDYIWLRTVSQIRVRVNFLTYTFTESGGNDINANAWNHLLVVRDASNNLTIFLNGAIFASSQVAAGDHRLDQIGKVGTSYYDGNVDETAFWDSDQSSNLATIYNSGVPNDISSLSPTLWYRMGDGDTSPTLTDNGSGGNNGTMVFFNTFSTDVPTASSFTNTKSILLDGFDDFVTMGAPSTLRFNRSDSFSFSAWVKREGTNSKTILSNQRAPSTNYRGYYFAIDNNAKLNVVFRSTLSDRLVFNGNLSLDLGWNHVVFTYDGTASTNSGQFYINGSADTTTGSGTLTGTAESTDTLYMGCRSNADNFFDGKLDEVSVFNSQLSQSDVTSIYNSGVPNDISSLSPLSWWRCGDGDTAPTLTDNGSGGNDGTMQSFTTFSTDVPT